MSLINDALKRAKQSESKGLAAAAGPTMRPVEAARLSGGSDFVLPGLIVVVLLCAGIFFWQWFRAGNSGATVRANYSSAPAKPDSAIATIPPAPVAAQPPVKAPVKAPEIVPTAVVAAQPAAKTPEPVTNVVAVAEPPKPAPVTYKLQSIFYFANNPTAMINGKTVRVGGKVGEARVLAISQESATIVTASGQTNVLELP